MNRKFKEGDVVLYEDNGVDLGVVVGEANIIGVGPFAIVQKSIDLPCDFVCQGYREDDLLYIGRL